LLKEAEEGVRRDAKATAIKPEELANAQAAQLEAFEDLRDWFNDWATTLRDVFGVADQIVLGLTTARGGRAAAEDVVEEEAEDDAEGAEGTTPVKAKPV